MPRTPSDIAIDALRCLAAGATIVHNHIDIVLGGWADRCGALFGVLAPSMEIIPDALLYPTVNAEPVEQSFAHFPLLATAGCRIGVVDVGSVNLGFRVCELTGGC